MKTYTKGKWKAVDKSEPLITCGDVSVAMCFDITGDEQIANSRLIAAAPYLYETAKEFVAGWSHFCKCIDFGRSGLDAKAIRFMNEVPAKIAVGMVKAEKGI